MNVTIPPEHPELKRILAEAVPGRNGCLIWTGALLQSGGYGQVRINGTVRRVHRVAYELMVGPIPAGLHVDHTCHNRDLTCLGGECLHRRCLSPYHLEPVTPRENARRSPHSMFAVQGSKERCDAGHAFDEANTYYRPDTGTRQCKKCSRSRDERRRRAAGAPTRADRWARAKEQRRPVEDAVIALYSKLGRRPREGEIVRLLVEINSPYTTGGFAKKLRADLEREHPELKGADYAAGADTRARMDQGDAVRRSIRRGQQ